ncbi:hypothetical protein [Halobacteriovorax sp. JY17]|uniref:hypothetical protein n=1 Tax=Halobacteriovorax sp. JY17 TaxID=2014617 RepID=UPI000C4CD676|nr:hypothetical protein [Halobacteriovorax sp. JY17]PIK15286.1 MAG: hypothetical protein CES88_00825 [Halobacteriovorax sp. JY17]
MIYLIEIFRNAKVIMRNVVGFLLLLLFSHSVFSQTAEKAQEMLNKAEKDAVLRRRLEPRISEKYYLGRFLIYDCEDRHFACVNLPSFFNCEEKREIEKENKNVFFSCAPLKQYKTLKDCTDAYMGFIYRRTNKAFCVNKVF